MTGPLIEEVAEALYAYNAAIRRQHGLTARSWQDLSERSQHYYFGAALAVVGSVGPAALGRASILHHSTRWTRIKDALRQFKERNLIADDPNGNWR